MLDTIGQLVKRYYPAVVLALSGAGAVAIVQHEGYVNTAYKDPVGIVTICAGHTRTAKLGQTKTNVQCDALLIKDVAASEAAVRRLVKVKLTQEQFDALVSFTFNLGEGALAKSTLLRKLNSGQCLATAAEFSKWVYAGKRKLPGLVTRREYERQQFETGCIK